MDKKHTVMVVLAILFLTACQPEKLSGCPRPPEGFSSASLVGTWGGTIDTAWDSTIIISADGRYKQIVNIKRTGFKYESDWLPWRLEYSSQGVAYLHLKSMMLCGAYYSDVECTAKNAITGFGTNWYDACQQKWDYIYDEGVFVVYPGSTPQKTQLYPFTKSSDGPTGPWYELREPAPPPTATR